MAEALPDLIGEVLSRTRDEPGTVLRFAGPGGEESASTSSEFVDEAFGLCNGLRRAGLSRGDIVAIRGTGGSRDFALSILAATFGGMVCVPLVSLLGDADVELILKLSGAKALLSETVGTTRDLAPHLHQLARERPELLVVDVSASRVVSTDADLELDDFTSRAETVGSGAAGAFVLFTSGTTNLPKGAVHTYDSLYREVLDWADQLDLMTAGRFLQPFPLGHVGGVAGLFLALVLGRDTTMIAPWNAQVAYDLIDRHAVTSMPSTPYFAQTLLDECDRRGRSPKTLKTMESGGGKVGSELVFRADHYGIALSRCYGSTEHPTVSTHHSSDPVEVRAATDGRPTGDSEILILDDSQRALPAGADGEIAIRGPEQFAGYISQTESPFLDGGWFCTGDVGHLTVGGHLVVTGRKKQIIIRGGENISISEVEEYLLAHPEIADAAVIGVPDVRYGERAYAFVVRREGGEPVDLAGIRDHFRALGVAKYKTPEAVEEVALLPRNALGKVQLHLLVPSHAIG